MAAHRLDKCFMGKAKRLVLRLDVGRACHLGERGGEQAWNGLRQERVVAQMLDSIYEKTNVVIRRIIILPGRAEVGLREHQAVLAAMRRGDAAEAEQLKRQNLRSAKETLLRFRNYVL